MKSLNSIWLLVLVAAFVDVQQSIFASKLDDELTIFTGAEDPALTCAWTQTVTRADEYECCKKQDKKYNFRSAINTSEYQRLQNTSRHMTCVEAIDRNLVESRTEFPKVCCEVLHLASVCEGDKDQEELNRLVRRSFKQYISRIKQRKSKVCKAVDRRCCAEPSSIANRGLINLGNEFGHPQMVTSQNIMVRDRFFLSVDYIEHVYECTKALLIHAITLRLDIPEICCDLPLIGLFCDKDSREKSTKKPVAKVTTTTTTPFPPFKSSYSTRQKGGGYKNAEDQD